MERLKRRAEFLRVQKGRRVHTGLFSVQALERVDGTSPRAGFTVSKRVSLKATVRNRIRRRLKEALKAEAGATEDAAVDFVIVAKLEALSAPFVELRQELNRALRRAKAPRGSATHRSTGMSND
ncbi:MAG: ribonuclease P protein component [Beijerinckiaceae bacterium]